MDTAVSMSWLTVVALLLGTVVVVWFFASPARPGDDRGRRRDGGSQGPSDDGAGEP